MVTAARPISLSYDDLLLFIIEELSTLFLVTKRRKTIQNYAELVGLRLGEAIDEMEKKKLSRETLFSVQQFSKTVISVFEEMGGEMSLHPKSLTGGISFRASSCPHGNGWGQTPDLCLMTCGFIAGLARRNLPYESLEFAKRIPAGDPYCQISIRLREADTLGAKKLGTPTDLVVVESCPLTVAERDVLTLVSRGMRNQEIANSLAYPLSTVKYYLLRILRKLEVRTRGEAATCALRKGWIV